ncbi:alanine racemase [Streptomyces sp. NPDC090053]|uniref:alanine racemase n=1 Tax=Streptomyces sp. NPDC090053 TaxID=3365932 RepID=UPI00380BF5C5
MHRSELMLDLSAVRRNAELLAKELSGAELWAVVKANAYGHGALAVSRTAMEAGASALCVATLNEGLALRQEIPRARIIVMGPISPNEIRAARDGKLECVAHTGEMARFLGDQVDYHLKINTGLNRWGIENPDLIPRGRAVGVMSQFATDGDPEITYRQLSVFLDVAKRVPGATRHIANSCAAWLFPETHLDAVRSGCTLVGFPPSPDADFGIQPTLRWTSYLAQTRRVAQGESLGYEGAYRVPKNSVMGIVPVGYADGFNAKLGGTRILVGDKSAQVVAVFMDAMSIILDEPAPVGSQVTLIGEGVSLDEHAKIAGIEPWELSAGIIDDPRRTLRNVTN